MEKSEIIEGNKLIAQFMGAIDPKENGPFKYSVHNQFWAAEGLQYDWNWGWLIDVVQKIGKDYNVRITWTAGAMEVTYIERPDIHDNSIADFGGFGTTMNTWMAVIKFIKWYNVKFKIKSHDKN